TYQDVTLTADELTYKTESGDIQASGNIVMREKESKINGSSMTYNIKSRVGHVEKIKVAYKPFYSQGKSIEMRTEKEIEVHEGFFTTCDLDHPHYRMEAKRIRLVMDDQIEAWDIVVYVGDVPILYLPYFSKA